MIMKKVILIAITFFVLISCSNYELQRKKIGEDLVEAKFVDDTLINGEAKFFDLNGNLESKANFFKGIKNGYAVNYYKNGVVKDSMYYTSNVLNGFFYSFDSSGFILFKGNNFHGLSAGDQYFFKDKTIKEYYFTNFERRRLVTCLYDSTGSCYSYFLNLSPVISDVLIKNEQPAINLFLYFPHPEGIELSYTIGLIDANNKRLSEVPLTSTNFFLDTTLAVPMQGSQYFISLKFKNLKDSKTEIFTKKFRDSASVK